jgi:hypothetical protein
VSLHGKGLRSLVGSTQMLPASNSRRYGLQNAKLKREVSGTSFSAHQVMDRTVVAKEIGKSKPTIIVTKGACICHICCPSMQTGDASKGSRIGRPHTCSFADATPQHLRIHRVSSCNHIRTREVARHTSNHLNHASSYPNPTSKTIFSSIVHTALGQAEPELDNYNHGVQCSILSM